MNVLADRHHSGLYHSFQLMAARFGWTLYTPVGHAWWDEGYWRFGQGYGDDRLAAQFLSEANAMTDSEFPDAPIRFISLEEARVLPWAYVIASVPDNEAGFARFAQEQGAQFVVQVGNTGQYVDWDRDPLVLSSSEMPILGRGVQYHQEMDPIAYREVRPWPAGLRPWVAIGSFVNCMSSMGSCWDSLVEARNLLHAAGEGSIHTFGIDGEDGIVKPFSAIVSLMGDVGWGWHDKAQGDGFGHVIHSWAAVGRPLIGHASHYAGKMAEPFWQDMVTCIDLDRHSIEETVEIVRTIKPLEHEAMCLAIRAEFERIDYAAEARSIADLLGLGVPA